MATSVLVPLEEYLATSYQPDREYVDGQFVERNLGEHDHSRLQTLIAAALTALEASHNIRVFVEQRVRVLDTPARKRYRVPDICVMRMPYTRSRALVEPPLLVIEILSPDDSMAEMLGRLDDYLPFGAPHVYLIDPGTRRLFQAGPEGLRDVRDRRLAMEPLFRLDLEPIFTQLDA